MLPDPLSAVARVIQLSVAPVFLLTSLGTILGVLGTRLARIGDRARDLVERFADVPDARRADVRAALEKLALRRRLIQAAITFATLAALLVCVLIAMAFVGSIVHADYSHLVAGLFIAAMVSFIVALLAFLGEVMVAVRSVSIEPG